MKAKKEGFWGRGMVMVWLCAGLLFAVTPAFASGDHKGNHDKSHPADQKGDKDHHDKGHKDGHGKKDHKDDGHGKKSSH